MNKTNVQHAINIMKRAGKFDMTCWQDTIVDAVKEEEKLLSCGTAACFAGWVAVSKEFKAYGGWCSPSGSPVIDIENPEISYEKEIAGKDAMAKWLGISIEKASLLCATGGGNYEYFYGCEVESITKERVIKKLEELLLTGTMEYGKMGTINE